VTKNNKLPAYFKEYLDEKFDHLIMRIDEMQERIDSSCSNFEEHLKDSSARFEKIEGWQENFNGKIAIVGGALLIGVNFLWDVVKDKLFSGR
jgi:hypothetical protein